MTTHQQHTSEPRVRSHAVPPGIAQNWAPWAAAS